MKYLYKKIMYRYYKNKLIKNLRIPISSEELIYDHINKITIKLKLDNQIKYYEVTLKKYDNIPITYLNLAFYMDRFSFSKNFSNQVNQIFDDVYFDRKTQIALHLTDPEQ